MLPDVKQKWNKIGTHKNGAKERYHIVNEKLETQGTTSTNYDTLQSRVDRHNDQSEKKWFVISATDLVLAKKGKQNFTDADFREFQKERLHELSEMFQGEASNIKRRMPAADITPKNLSRLGHLVQMKGRLTTGGKFTLNFNGDSYLAIDLRKNLYCTGRGAIINGIPRPKQGTLKILGKLTQIDYITAKQHIKGGKLVRFWHPLGEIDKDYPTLAMDAEGFPVIIGGGYDVWKVGIVN